jgi:hypothetical protein
MHKPMITNTLEDAALWLTKAMERDWTPRQVLDAVIRTCDQTAKYPLENVTCLRVLPPKNTVFGIYKRDPQSYAVALQSLTLDCEFQLTFDAAFDLFTRNETNVSIVKNAVSNDEPYVVIEPRAESLRVTLDMVRISAGALQGLAMAYEQEKRLLPIKQDEYLDDWGVESRAITHAYLAKIAHLHGWDTYTARKLIVNCTEQLSKWDGSLLAVLKAGPQPAPEQHTAMPAIAKNKRPDLLTPLIEKAQRDETDPFNVAVIWPKLCDMAERKTRPLIDVSAEGIKWTDGNDTVQFLTKKALSDRLRRMKTAR